MVDFGGIFMEKQNTLKSEMDGSYEEFQRSYSPSDDLERQLEQDKERQLFDMTKSKIERYAVIHPDVAAVVDGSATFYSYGEPIIDHVRNVEESYLGRKFGFVSKKNLLGRNSPSEVQDSVNRLQDGEIIDPQNYFCSRLIFPGVAGAVHSMVNVMNRRPWSSAIGMVLGAGSLGATSGGYLRYQIWGAEAAVVTGFGGYILANILGLGLPSIGNCNVDKISKQRKRFENALNGLDSHVRKHFPLSEQGYREVGK